MHALINGHTMHWLEQGSGDPVLFVHAFPLHGGMWAPQFEQLPPRWRLLAPDLRGYGRSALPDGSAEPLTVEQLADDLAALLDFLEIGRATVCGLSMGGYVAFALWRRHPERVRALVLADTRAGADAEEARANRRTLAARVRAEGAAAAARALLPKLLSGHAPASLRRLVRIMIEAADPESIARTSEGLALRPDSTDLLPGITVPALILVGAEDEITPVAESERMAAAMPRARLAVLADAGHLSNLEDPVRFNREIEHFLDVIPGQ